MLRFLHHEAYGYKTWQESNFWLKYVIICHVAW